MRWRRIPIPLALALAALSFTGDLSAQHDPRQHSGDPSASQGLLAGTPQELEVSDLVQQQKYLTARTKAQAILDANPNSIIGNYAMGIVLAEAEGDLSRAMYFLGNARKLFEAHYGAPPSKSGPWRFHRQLLYATQVVAGEMEEFDYQLQVLDYYDSLYDPKLVAEHAWPFMQLRRFDDARHWVDLAMKSGDPREVLTAKNALCAVECEARGRDACYRACSAAYDAGKEEQAREKQLGQDELGPSFLTVLAYNTASSAYTVFKLDEAERVAKEATAGLPATTANPWRELARLYTAEGRIAEAVAAAREMQSWRAHQPPSMRDQDHSDTDSALGELLLAVGEPEAALLLVTRAIERPDRRGLVSSKEDQALGCNATLRRVIARTAAERDAEKTSAAGWTARAKNAALSLPTLLDKWGDDERVASIMTDDTRLDSTFRVYLAGGIEPLPIWVLGDLVPIVGAGVVQVVLDRARAEEAGQPTSAAVGPYYDALEAEVAYRTGDYGRALSLTNRALADLPKAEALLSARVAAIGAESARKSGDDAGAMRFYGAALQRDAGVFRRLGLAIPATVRSSGDATADLVGKMLTASPRLRSDAGFTVNVDHTGNVLRACLLSPEGAQISCATTTAQDKEAPKDWALREADAFHKTVFTIGVSLTQEDLQSLDGSTTVASQAQREQMKDMLKGLGGDAPP
jgi:hypothetical protein